MESIQLPRTVEDLQDQFESEQLAFPKLLQKCKFPGRNPNSKLIWQFSIPGLRNGRPLDRVVVLLSGERGSGRSSTINTLFHDQLLSLSKQPYSSDVHEYVKSLTVTSFTPPLLADLCFVDLPGLLESENSEYSDNSEYSYREEDEAVISEKIHEFRRNSASLQNHTIPQNFQRFKLQDEVYPNLVVSFHDATKYVEEGGDSTLQKSLDILSKHEFVDDKNSNLIIVVTHAATLGVDLETYDKKSEEVKSIIQKAVLDTLGIAEVPIVFVENDPDSYQLEKNGDFYLLPNGKMSHATLITELFNIFNKGGDKLALLLTSWYFKSDCPDKVPVVKSAPRKTGILPQNQQLFARGGSSSYKKTGVKANDETIPQFHAHSIGYAYCPVTEILKMQNVFELTPYTLQTLIVGKARFLIPKYVQNYLEQGAKFQSLICESKETYESNKKTQYGMEADIQLLVGVSSTGKWISSKITSSHSNVISVLYEIRHCTLQIDAPEHYISKEFKYALNSLPDSYDPKNPERFNELFSKYGTHLVCKQSLGGWIKFDCTIKTANYNKDTLSRVEAKASGFFNYFSSLGANFSTEATYKELNAMGMSDEKITIEGGDMEDLPLLTSIREMTPEIFQKWKKTVEKNPAQLRHSIVLYPFYNLACTSGPISASLREATVDFLSQRMDERIKSKRDEIARKAYDQAMRPPEKRDCKCFPAETKVITKDGEKRIGELKERDEVASLTGKMVKWTKFLAFLHKEDKMGDYLRLEFNNGKRLLVSEEHLVFVQGNEGQLVPRKAGKMEIGDKMVYTDGEGVVTMAELVGKEIEEHEGVYCPLTMEGTFLANGFLVSCYADIEDFNTAHVVFGPLRMWYTIKGALGPRIGGNSQEQSGIHEYAKFLMKVRELVWKYLLN